MLNHLKSDLQEIKISLRTYLRNPVQEIRRLPHWSWRRILTAQLLITMFTGLLTSLVHRTSGFGIFMGLIEMPFLTLLLTFIISLFFFYIFQLFQQIFVEFRELYLAVFFANIPFFIFHIVSDFFPPLLLIGLGFSCLLLIVAFVDNFKVSRKFASRLLIGIYSVMVVMNLTAWWQSARSLEHFRDHSVDHSLDKAPEVKLGN